MRVCDIPIPVLTDSYKASHYLQYPDAKRMIAYGEFRRGYEGDEEDVRIVWYGIRYVVENFVARQWTMKDVEDADAFYATHQAPMYTAYPYPRELFEKFIMENNGYMPVKVQALPEGTAIAPHVPVFQISAENEYSRLCTFLETLLVQTWYPTTVATHSKRAKDIISDAFELSVDGGKESPLLGSRLHDFGFRGCTCLEQSVLGGAAHLLNFDGTDTMSAAYYVQFALNEGKPVGTSIPASEHSVMTAWPSERQALENMIQKFGTGLFATVMDSYDYQNALDNIVPTVAKLKEEAGGFWVLRPDSGDPTEAVVAALKAAEKTFGADTNSKGYKVTRGVGCIQGDGINTDTIRKILHAVHKQGYSAQNVAFGMGGGLLQRLNRDTLSMAVKLNHITYADGSQADVMKCPVGVESKLSLPGELAVKMVDNTPTVYPAEDVLPEENLLQTVYDNGPISDFQYPTFTQIRETVDKTWSALPKKPQVLSDVMLSKSKLVKDKIRASIQR